MEKELEGLKQELIRLLNNLSVEGNDVIASTAKRKVSDCAQEFYEESNHQSTMNSGYILKLKISLQNRMI